jgi:hypothetical protein
VSVSASTFRGMVASWQAEGKGEALSADLFGVVRVLVRPVARSLGMDVGDAVNAAYEVLRRSRLPSGDIRPWLVGAVRAELKGAAATDRLGVSRRVFSNVLPGLHTDSRGPLSVCVEDAALERALANPRFRRAHPSQGKGSVFDELEERLVKDSGWPEETARQCVRELDYAVGARKHALPVESFRQELWMVPVGERALVARFLLAPDGYLGLRVKGVPPGEARLLAWDGFEAVLWDRLAPWARAS